MAGAAGWGGSAAQGYVQAVGNISAGLATARAQRYNAAIYRMNADAQQNSLQFVAEQEERNAVFATQDAAIAKQAAVFAEQQFRLATGRRQGENRVLIGASGVTLEGSPLETMVNNAYEIETQALLIEYQGALDERAALESASQHRLAAEARRYEGRQALWQGDQQAQMARFYGRLAMTEAAIKTTSDQISAISGGMGGG